MTTAEVRERVSKPEVKISNRLTAFENLDVNEDISRI
jgi:hypothetical protein